VILSSRCPDCFTAGGAQADSRRTEYHFDGTDFAIYAAASTSSALALTFPTLAPRTRRLQQPRGTYTFASSTDFRRRHSTTYVLQTGRGHVVFWKG